MKIIVAGGGVSGLMSALALGRAGHEVVVVERDGNAVPPTAGDAFSTWQRPGAPHVRHSHAFLARLRALLRDRAPDVLAALLDAGATEIRVDEMMPATMGDRTDLIMAPT